MLSKDKINKMLHLVKDVAEADRAFQVKVDALEEYVVKIAKEEQDGSSTDNTNSS